MLLRTLDILLIVIMTAVATITYTIKHRAEEKLGEVRKLEAISGSRRTRSTCCAPTGRC